MSENAMINKDAEAQRRLREFQNNIINRIKKPEPITADQIENTRRILEMKAKRNKRSKLLVLCDPRYWYRKIVDRSRPE